MSLTPARRLAAVAVIAIVAVTAAVAASSSSGQPERSPAVTAVAEDLLAGIDEQSGVLGDPRAPITVTEFVDLQCPVCAAASREVVPTLIDDYVRAGKVKLDAQVLSFLGPDSVTAARHAAAARAEDRLWPYLETFFANQGLENSGYVTEDFLAGVAEAAGVEAATEGSGQADLEAANAEAERLGVTGTPTFVVQRGDGREEVLSAAELLPALSR